MSNFVKRRTLNATKWIKYVCKLIIHTFWDDRTSVHDYQANVYRPKTWLSLVHFLGVWRNLHWPDLRKASNIVSTRSSRQGIRSKKVMLPHQSKLCPEFYTWWSSLAKPRVYEHRVGYDWRCWNQKIESCLGLDIWNFETCENAVFNNPDIYTA